MRSCRPSQCPRRSEAPVCAPCASGSSRTMCRSGRASFSPCWSHRAVRAGSRTMVDVDTPPNFSRLPEPLVGALRELARTRDLLVALDFDGTLAPVVNDPTRARALPEAREAVLRLLQMPRTRVAVVSGRSLESLEAVSDLPDET